MSKIPNFNLDFLAEIRVLQMVFKVGSRVESNEEPKKFGNVTQSVRKLVWMVRWDNEAQEVERGSRSMKLVSAITALSPGARGDLAERGDTEVGGNDDVDDYGSDSGSAVSEGGEGEEEEEDAPLHPNIHVQRSMAFDAKMEKLYGTKIEASVHSLAFYCDLRL